MAVLKEGMRLTALMTVFSAKLVLNAGVGWMLISAL